MDVREPVVVGLCVAERVLVMLDVSDDVPLPLRLRDTVADNETDDDTVALEEGEPLRETLAVDVPLDVRVIVEVEVALEVVDTLLITEADIDDDDVSVGVTVEKTADVLGVVVDDSVLVGEAVDVIELVNEPGNDIVDVTVASDEKLTEAVLD